MNFLDRALTLLSEKEREIIPKELSDRAQKAGVSIEDIRKCNTVDQVKRLIDKKYHEKEKSKPKEKSEPKEKGLTTAQFNKICKDAAKDWKADNKDEDLTLADVAWDLADSLLYDIKIKEYVKKKLGNEYSKDAAKEYIADTIHG